ncbi:MAG: DUF4292 domain-containing protein [SAR324 cluster bacterium]|nr:DUF4292 domain-containing protein [SAR324 cluster bacterium]
MKHLCQWFFIIIYSSCIAGCLTTPEVVIGPQNFLSTQPFPGYQSSGRILLANEDQKYAGELKFNLSKNFELHIQIFAPIIGTLVYEVRANHEQFMILDFGNQKYLLEENISPIRHEWLGIDVSLDELSWMIWGRIPNSKFQQYHGQMISQNKIQLFSEDSVLLMTLSPNGLLQSVQKKNEDATIYEAFIRKYQNVAGRLYPEKIQITQQENRGKLLLVMLDIDSGTQNSPLSFQPAEGMTTYSEE